MKRIVDQYGIVTEQPDTEGMLYPVRCMLCGHAHDASKTPTAVRYADCDVWACPNCDRLIDNRPACLGGTAKDLREGR